MAVFVLRCSIELARKLGVRPAERAGIVYRIPDNCISIDVAKDEGAWFWLLDDKLLNEHIER